MDCGRVGHWPTWSVAELTWNRTVQGPLKPPISRKGVMTRAIPGSVIAIIRFVIA